MMPVVDGKCFWSLEELMEHQNPQMTHSVTSAHFNINMNSVRNLCMMPVIDGFGLEMFLVS